MATNTDNRSYRQFLLIRQWEQHCEQAGHKPRAEGGTATFDHNMAATYITCCNHGCKWSASADASR